MKISTKGRYALRLMVELAAGIDEGVMPLKTIAARQDISEKYLEQIVSPLSRAGYVRSVRGAGGGYVLSKPAEMITVGMVLRVMEGSLAPVSCLEQEENTCERAYKCVTLNVWKKIKEAVENVVDNITLKDLAEDYHKTAGADYVI